MLCLRPGIMKPSNEQKNVTTTFKILGSFGWLANKLNMGNPLEDVGKCMIQLCFDGYDKNILECKDIVICAKKFSE